MIKGLASTGFGRYTQTMHLLVAGILQKIQFRLDSDLSILDNESLDDDVSMNVGVLLIYTFAHAHSGHTAVIHLAFVDRFLRYSFASTMKLNGMLLMILKK